MTKSNLPKNLRKHIREEKGRLRRTIADPAEQAKRIEDLLTQCGARHHVTQNM